MQSLLRALALALAVAATAFSSMAQGQPPGAYDNQATSGADAIPPPNAPAGLTGKERLGRKWMDEQRIDNCKVPAEMRGAKPRPEACAHSPTE